MLTHFRQLKQMILEDDIDVETHGQDATKTSGFVDQDHDNDVS
jgi:hypothetical protein